MNWGIIAACASLLGVLVTIIIGAYNSGQVRQQITDHTTVLENHAKTFVLFAERLSAHDVKLAELRAWKDGFDAGARSSNKPSEV